MSVLRLRQNETVAVFELGTLGPGTYYRNLIADGNALVSTLYLDQCDAGASIRVSFEDVGLSELPSDLVTLGSHEIMTVAQTVSKTSVVRFHNRPRVKVVIVGGSVTFGHWITLKTESVSDIAFGLGKTTVLTGSTLAVGESTLTAPGERLIQQLSIRCAIDQANSHRLLFSLDNGLAWVKLAPGEAFSIAPRGEINHIKIKSNGHEVAYEIVLATSP